MTENIYFKIIGGSGVPISLEKIAGVKIPKYVIPVIGNIIKFSPDTNVPHNNYHSRKYLVKAIEVELIYDMDGSVIYDYYITIQKINQSVKYFLNKK